MSTLIRSIHNSSSSVSHTLLVPGYDPENPVVLAPSATLDLLSVVSAETLHAMQGQLASLVADGSITSVATINSSLLWPATTPSVIARYSDIGVTTDISVYTTVVTVPTTGIYQISAYRVATASATGTDTSGNLIIGWTDETGTQALQFDSDSAATAGTFGGLTMAVHAIGGTVVKFYTSGTSGPWATLVEDIFITVVAL